MHLPKYMIHTLMVQLQQHGTYSLVLFFSSESVVHRVFSLMSLHLSSCHPFHSLKPCTNTEGLCWYLFVGLFVGPPLSHLVLVWVCSKPLDAILKYAQFNIFAEIFVHSERTVKRPCSAIGMVARPRRMWG